jgi:glycosyltransferase involved in cell wall biosynthesis
MKPLTVVAPHGTGTLFENTLLSLAKSELVENVVILTEEPVRVTLEKCHVFAGGPLPSHETLSRILPAVKTKYLLLFLRREQASLEPRALEKILEKADSTRAGLVYSDYYDVRKENKTLHPLNDYQPGSVRDDFDFGAVILFSIPALKTALEKYGPIPAVKFAGLYDLRLKLSIDHAFFHLKEPLYHLMGTDQPARSTGAIHPLPPEDKIFVYVDPRNAGEQEEMETVFTDYLKKIGAYLPPHRLRELDKTAEPFPVEASVVIPVRNRRETVAEAVKSALSQETDFQFNVIVVDNHSKDGTTAVLSDMARRDSKLNHIVPTRTDLGIGGCWNEALQYAACGRYAVQLDSDDLYSSRFTLQKMVHKIREGQYALVIGAYTLVNERLKEIPPGLIDHREWTDENGHNNALRINGLGAPRAFDTGIMRKIGFLNASYGEDYAAALRICREYRIGRIYDSLYLCRRWPGNTDAGLSIEEANRNDAFKDKTRTDEIAARQRINKGRVLNTKERINRDPEPSSG